MEAGLNLYSIRNYLETEESFLNAAIKLKEMGYSYLQYSGGAFDPDRIKRVGEASGLPIVFTHAPLDRILHDTEALMEEHARFGCRRIGLGSMPRPAIINEALCRQTIEDLDRAGECMQKNGFSFFYHHHHFEFFRHGASTVFDILVENAPHINITLDTYWLQYGGGDILKTIARLNGRIECVHLKDYQIISKEKENGKLAFEPIYAPVGDGNLNFREIVAAMKDAGTQYFFVEQDNAALHPDTLGQVERSIRYIRTQL